MLPSPLYTLLSAFTHNREHVKTTKPPPTHVSIA